MITISENEPKRALTTLNLSRVDVERIADRTNGTLKLYPLKKEVAPHLEYRDDTGKIILDIRLDKENTSMFFVGIGILNFPKPLKVELTKDQVSFINEEAVQIPGNYPENEFKKLTILKNGVYSLSKKS